jgi:hypothetical protein
MLQVGATGIEEDEEEEESDGPDNREIFSHLWARKFIFVFTRACHCPVSHT